MDKCARCGRILTADEVAMTKKMVNRAAQSYYCLSCLAAHYEVSVDVLREKIVQFRRMGCTLFVSADSARDQEGENR